MRTLSGPFCTFLGLAALFLVGCSASPTGTTRTFSSGSVWGKDAADGTRPFFCTEPRIAEIARQNTEALRVMSQAPTPYLPDNLLGPQRKDALHMADGRAVEAWYYRSYVDSVDTSMAYSVGLTPIIVDSQRHVQAVGAAASDLFKMKAISIKTIAYLSPCNAEMAQMPTAITQAPKSSGKRWFW